MKRCIKAWVESPEPPPGMPAVTTQQDLEQMTTVPDEAQYISIPTMPSLLSQSSTGGTSDDGSTPRFGTVSSGQSPNSIATPGPVSVASPESNASLDRLDIRGKGSYTCPHGLNCKKGGVQGGKPRVFTRNSEFKSVPCLQLQSSTSTNGR